MVKSYILAARPKTLPAAVVPVWVGCTLAWKSTGKIDWPLALFTLLGALCIQIATNLFNDVIDHEKGADTRARLGPQRVTAGGLLSSRAVYGGACLFLLLACLASLPLVHARGSLVIAIGLPSLYLCYGYTGGPFPLAYLGLGELFVILFFGLVAVGGTFYVQTGEWVWSAGALGMQVGLLCAVLIAINNLRDLEEDRESGKRTLGVRFGRNVLQRVIVGFVVLALILSLCGLWYGAPWFPLFSVPWFAMGAICIRGVRSSLPGKRYNRFLGYAALQLVLFAFFFMVAVAV